MYFVACGGSLAAMYPAKYLLESESKTLKVGYYTSNEFVYATPKACGKNSLVICCTKGGTAETIKACQKARELGAATVAVVGFEENPMVKEADEYIVFGGTAQMSKNNLALVLMMAFELLYQIEDYDKYEDAVAAYEKSKVSMREGGNTLHLGRKSLPWNIRTNRSSMLWAADRLMEWHMPLRYAA